MEIAGVEGGQCPVGRALDGFRQGADALIEAWKRAGATCLDEAGLIRFLQRFERVRNRIRCVDHRGGAGGGDDPAGGISRAAEPDRHADLGASPVPR